jgi:hypothetical protein
MVHEVEACKTKKYKQLIIAMIKSVDDEIIEHKIKAKESEQKAIEILASTVKPNELESFEIKQNQAIMATSLSIATAFTELKTKLIDIIKI